MTAPIPDEPRSQETSRELVEVKLTTQQETFVARTLQPVEQHQLVRLSAHESDRIAEALLDAPEPTSALTEVVRRYRDLIGG